MRRALLGLYVVFLGVVVAVANLGGTHEVFGFLGHVPFGDKIGHFVFMGVFALLADLACRRRDVGPVPLGPLVVVGLVTLEELSQLFLVTRSFDLVDLAADMAGIAVFTMASRLAALRRVPRHP